MLGIPMGTNCTPLLPDLFLCSYENEFLDIKLIKAGKRKFARKFNLSHHYTDDFISFDNKRFKELFLIFTPRSSPFPKPQNLPQLLLISICFSPQIKVTTTKLYDKRDTFGVHIVNFPFMSSNIPSAPAYGAYASQLIPLLLKL